MSAFDLPSRTFAPRIYGVGAWTDNLPFAYDLIALLKPRRLLELGTDRGESYFAFCQSVAEHQTGTVCYAVDTWEGDHQAGGYDETTFAEVSAHNAAHYGSFSTLLRCRFDEALEKFEPQSIDVIHLDGLHTEAAVRHDVESWLPKIVPGGLLLMHDVMVRTRDFGVWKVWEELTDRGRSFTFPNGPGLGVWEKPPARQQPAMLETMLGAKSGGAAACLDYYKARARELQQRIAQHWRDGSIRKTAAAHQTIVQVFYTRDGVHREEDSVVGRVGHESWKEILLVLPPRAGAAPLRIDFLSAFTTIDIAGIQVLDASRILFDASEPEAFSCIAFAGDAERIAHATYLRVKVTGPDPQLHLPNLEPADDSQLEVKLRLRVSASAPPDV